MADAKGIFIIINYFKIFIFGKELFTKFFMRIFLNKNRQVLKSSTDATNEHPLKIGNDVSRCIGGGFVCLTIWLSSYFLRFYTSSGFSVF